MHYYSFHIGDYRAATAHLSNEEDLAYRRLIDMYYDLEAPIPFDTQWVSRRIRVGVEVVEIVLKDMFELTEDGWRLARCDEEISRYHRNAEKNKANGIKGGRPPKNPMGCEQEPNEKATREPTTIEPLNQEPKKSERKRNTRLPADWELPTLWMLWAQKERPDLDVESVSNQFRDYWVGTGKAMADWEATWRNWVRREKQQIKTFASKPNANAALFASMTHLHQHQRNEEEHHGRTIDVTPLLG